jgi:hypothetical protein
MVVWPSESSRPGRARGPAPSPPPAAAARRRAGGPDRETPRRQHALPRRRLRVFASAERCPPQTFWAPLRLPKCLGRRESPPGRAIPRALRLGRCRPASTRPPPPGGAGFGPRTTARRSRLRPAHHRQAEPASTRSPSPAGFDPRTVTIASGMPSPYALPGRPSPRQAERTHPLVRVPPHVRLGLGEWGPGAEGRRPSPHGRPQVATAAESRGYSDPCLQCRLGETDSMRKKTASNQAARVQNASNSSCGCREPRGNDSERNHDKTTVACPRSESRVRRAARGDRDRP